MPPEAAPAEGPPKARPRRCINCAKRTIRRGRSTPPRGHTAPDGPNPRATVHEATRRSPYHGLDPTERLTRSHARVGMTLPPVASTGTTLTGRGTGMYSVTAMRPAQNRAAPDIPRPTLLLSRAISALAAR
jgi:hypothetical protein